VHLFSTPRVRPSGQHVCHSFIALPRRCQRCGRAIIQLALRTLNWLLRSHRHLSSLATIGWGGFHVVASLVLSTDLPLSCYRFVVSPRRHHSRSVVVVRWWFRPHRIMSTLSSRGIMGHGVPRAMHSYSCSYCATMCCVHCLLAALVAHFVSCVCSSLRWWVHAFCSLHCVSPLVTRCLPFGRCIARRSRCSVSFGSSRSRAPAVMVGARTHPLPLL
jgi:hypothetical protein